jgi:hypothetical protein
LGEEEVPRRREKGEKEDGLVDGTDLLLCSQVTSAKEAATKVESELGNLNTTLKNIEDARPFDQLTVCPFSLCSS